MTPFTHSRRAVAVLACGLSLYGCGPARITPASFEHDAYVWQRQWTAALDDALVQSAPFVTRWRVLAAEVTASGSVSESPFDPARLRRTQKPVVLVIRINGQIAAWNSGDITRQSLALVSRWRAAGVTVAGLEIDHDCATYRLPAYADFLKGLRDARPGGLALSITALPAWLDSARLPDVLSRVDEAIVQVHSVTNPTRGLFDSRQASAWIAAWSAATTIPFRVALPTYGSRISVAGTSRIAVVESEVPRHDSQSNGVEVFARPQDVAEFLAEVLRRPAPSLAGIVWFRVPTTIDRRAWSLQTWHAVMLGRPAAPEVTARVVAGDAPGVLDVYLVNEGGLDDRFPDGVEVLADHCTAADALPPYTMEKHAGRVRFQLTGSRLLRARRQALVGWVRCPRDRVDVAVHF